MAEINATPGAADANSYNTLDEFAAFLETKTNVPAVVTSATAPQRTAAAIEAAELLDLEPFSGSRASDTQARAWPRSGARKPDADGFADAGLYGFGAYFSSSEIPPQIKRAHNELAYALLAGTYNPGADSNAAVEEFSADGVKIRYGNGGRAASAPGSLPTVAARYLNGLLRGNRRERC